MLQSKCRKCGLTIRYDEIDGYWDSKKGNFYYPVCEEDRVVPHSITWHEPITESDNIIQILNAYSEVPM